MKYIELKFLSTEFDSANKNLWISSLCSFR